MRLEAFRRAIGRRMTLGAGLSLRMRSNRLWPRITGILVSICGRISRPKTSPHVFSMT